MATEQQQYKLAGLVVEHQSSIREFSNEDAQWAIQNTAEAIRIWGEAIKNRAKVAVETLLEIIGTILIPASAGTFIARDKFVKDTSKNAKVKISFVGDNFKKWFGNKVEDAGDERTLRYAKLLKSSGDGPIIAELGDKAEVSLQQVFSLMEMQPNGEEGVLLINGWANIFYVKDQNNVLRAVYVLWYDDGWLVNAIDVSIPGAWSDGSQVFSQV
jgi:hypothetical protein